MALRQVTRTVTPEEVSEGAGVRVRRSIGSASLDHLDPFLLLDEFKSDRPGDYIAGFPDHPHRGFETVTYMLAGSMVHQDHRGHRGELVAGGVQWMTAGRGIIHSEMPRQAEGLMWGFQLWVNLPARLKMTEPRYQEFPPARIPQRMDEGGVIVRVIAGESDGATGAVDGIATQPLFLDVALPAGRSFVQRVPAGHNAFAYAVEGDGEVGGRSEGDGQATGPGQLLVLGDGDEVRARAAAEAPFRLLLVAARPLREPIARYGPFVMNTRQELVQAFEDYQRGTLLG
jgi:quercetin 2,3-dioxygenase